MTSVGVVSSVLFLIPVVIICINLLGMTHGHKTQEREDSQGVAVPFLRLGVYAFLILGIVGAYVAWPSISGAVQFTGVTEAIMQLWLMGAITFPLFGAMYEAIPQLLGRDCWCKKLSELHYWLTLTGFWALITLLILEGLFVGLALSDPTVSFRNITSYAYPFAVLEVLAQILLSAAAIMLGINITRALVGGYLLQKR
jgi:cbb3-type cytochrome oxidase subunit 1